MTSKQRKIIVCASFELILFGIMLGMIVDYFVPSGIVHSVLHIVAIVVLVCSMSITLFSRTKFTIYTRNRITKFRSMVSSISWVLAGLAVIFKFASIPLSKLFAVLALPPVLLHFVTDLIFYLRGDLKIE